MSDIDQEWIKSLERTHEAVRKFSRSKFDGLARSIVYRMRRFPASGIYRGDAEHKTLWDEYRYEQRHGPSDPQVVTAWNDALKPYLDEALASIAVESAVLLSIYSVWDLEGGLEICGTVWPDGMREVLEKFLIAEAASDRKRPIAL